MSARYTTVVATHAKAYTPPDVTAGLSVIVFVDATEPTVVGAGLVVGAYLHRARRARGVRTFG